MQIRWSCGGITVALNKLVWSFVIKKTILFIIFTPVYVGFDETYGQTQL